MPVYTYIYIYIWGAIFFSKSPWLIIVSRIGRWWVYFSFINFFRLTVIREEFILLVRNSIYTAEQPQPARNEVKKIYNTRADNDDKRQNLLAASSFVSVESFYCFKCVFDEIIIRTRARHNIMSTHNNDGRHAHLAAFIYNYASVHK